MASRARHKADGHTSRTRRRSSRRNNLFCRAVRSYGNIVIIEHGKGWNSLITNLDSVEVTKGQKIDQGALLGRAGKKDPKLALNCAKMAA
jgi:murein DD-endopeptidase MepM/ murein hydrolase activator NlpD